VLAFHLPIAVNYIDRDTVLRIVENFADCSERLRRRTRLLALRRFVVLVGRVSRGLGSRLNKDGQPAKAMQGKGAVSNVGQGSSDTNRTSSPKRRPSRFSSSSFLKSSPQRGKRWRAALTLHNAQSAAVQSFKRKEGLGTELTMHSQALGSELDQRVEMAREAQLCSTLFALATSAASVQRNLGQPAPAQTQAATSVLNAPVLVQSKAICDGSTATSVLTLASDATSVQVSSYRPAALSNGDAGNNHPAGTEGKDESGKPTPATSGRPTQKSSLRRQQRSCDGGNEAKLAAEQGEAEPSHGRSLRRARTGSGSRSRLFDGFETLNARVDLLAASNEAMREDVSRLVSLLTAKDEAQLSA
jgi:hypothetical protein